MVSRKSKSVVIETVVVEFVFGNMARGTARCGRRIVTPDIQRDSNSLRVANFPLYINGLGSVGELV